jgi:hypothetical protein
MLDFFLKDTYKNAEGANQRNGWGNPDKAHL